MAALIRAESSYSMINDGAESGSNGPNAGDDKQDRPALLSETAMLEAEEKFLWPEGAPSFRAGLALSGGGVRAATVALGVLQVLAERGLLARFHYLSSVSGGGYIASSLSWFWCKKRVEEEAILSPRSGTPPVRFGAEAGSFPFQDPTETPTETPPGGSIDLRPRAVENLKFLRNHGSYLTSGDGIGFAGLIIAVLRTILLSVMVWLPLLVFLFGIFEVVDSLHRKDVTFESCISAGPTPPVPAIGSEAVSTGAGESAVQKDLGLSKVAETKPVEDAVGKTTEQAPVRDVLKSFQCRPSYRVLLILAAVPVVLFFCGVILFSFLSRLQLDSSIPGSTPRRRYTIIVGYFLVCIGSFATIMWLFIKHGSIQPLIGVEIALLTLLGMAFLMLAFAEFFSPQNRAYFLRRSFEKYSSIVLPIVVAAIFIGALPLIVASLKPATDQASASMFALGPLGGVVTLLSGVSTALYGYYLKAKSLLPGIAGQIFAMSGSLLFLSGLLLFSFVLAGEIFVATQGSKPFVITVLLSLVILAFLIGMFGSVNATGLYRFYRDRLMETFMPMASAVGKGTARESDVADNLSVADVLRDAQERDNRPYHLVNAHAILVNDDDPKIALRGGDNFLMSSAFVGSSATGWMRTRDYVRHHGALTLASAMAVSGAAANANAGYTGAGLTRDRFVSAVMSLLNIRLGLWVGNPRATAKIDRTTGAADSKSHDRILTRLKAKVATYFRPVLTCGIFGFGYHREATFLELSDGGHFENLGLYELIRRRLDLVVVVDAEQDSNISLSALVSSTNRIREDFGVKIRFLDSKGPERLLGKDSDRYPGGVRIAKSPFVAAEIVYPGPNARRGVLIYIKSTMVTGLEFATEGYKATNPDFPHQSTLDQFFDPDQFEAYRDLGKKSCAAMIKELCLECNFGKSSKLLECYGFPSNQVQSVSDAQSFN